MVDNLTPEQRSYCMSRVKGKDTGLERQVRAALRLEGLRFRIYAKALPGKPDVVFPLSKVAVFIDGDFWHGYRFPQWKRKVSSFWQVKIDKSRRRDRKNFAKLRRMGWRVVRIWQHELEKDLASCIRRITSAVRRG
jgi:DNA mismatch endonuclease (patch repair protein)